MPSPTPALFVSLTAKRPLLQESYCPFWQITLMKTEHLKLDQVLTWVKCVVLCMIQPQALLVIVHHRAALDLTSTTFNNYFLFNTVLCSAKHFHHVLVLLAWTNVTHRLKTEELLISKINGLSGACISWTISSLCHCWLRVFNPLFQKQH